MRHLGGARMSVVEGNDGVVQRGRNAARKQHHGLGQHAAQRRRGRACQRMAGRQRQQQRLGRHQGVGQAGRGHAAGQQHQAGVDVAARQQLLLHVARGLDQLQVHAGRGGAPGRHPARQQLESGSGNKGQTNLPRVAQRGALRQRGQALGARQQLARLGQQGGAGGGQLHAAAVALEQARTQRALQPGNGLRQRRLGDVQARGRAAEVQLLGHRHKLAPLP